MRPLYIQTNDRSSFGKAFRTQLITELTNLGYIITYSAEDAMLVRWSVNKIHHKAQRKASSLPGKYTAATAIGWGVWKLFDNSSYFVGSLAIGALLDVTENMEGLVINKNVPNNEIVLTLSISKNSFLFSRQSGTYYINGADTWHYNNIADFEGQPEMHLEPTNFNVVNN
jgi:hypothetical protein